MLWKCCIQYVSEFGKLSSSHRTGKGQFSFQSQRRTMPKNAQTTCTVVLILDASKVMLKILQARLQQYMNRECPDGQAGFRKDRRNQGSNCQNSLDHRESKGISCFLWKHEADEETSASLTMLKSLTMWITTNWKILKEIRIPGHLTCLTSFIYRSRSNN